MSEPSQKPGALARRVKQHIKGRSHRFFAVCHPGFEETSRLELESLGIKEILEVTTGGILFKGKIEDCYRVNLMARTVTRLLLRVTSFNVLNFSTLKDLIAEIPWELYLNPETSFSFSITARKSRLYHTDRVEEEVRSGLAERLRQFSKPVKGRETGPRQQIFIRLYRDRCTVSLDSSGELLYRRGQRVNVNEAPLRETRAAAILQAAHFLKYESIIDPMCGSGTFTIEGADMARGKAAGASRNFTFEQWPVFSRPAFLHLKKSIAETVDSTVKLPQFFASDIDEKSLEAAQENLSRANLGEKVSITQKDFFEPETDRDFKLPSLILLNPPYGKRLETGNVEGLYRRIGTMISSHYKDYGFAIIVPGPEAEKALGCAFDRKITFKQGGIPVALLIKDAFK